MPTSTMYKFNDFIADCMNKVHDLSTDTIEVRFCASANPPVATNGQLSDLTVIDASNFDSLVLSASGRSSSQTSGTYTFVLADKTLTASGGAIPTFRYAVIFNQSAANDELICYYDYGGDVTVGSGETFDLDFGAQVFSIPAS